MKKKKLKAHNTKCIHKCAKYKDKRALRDLGVYTSQGVKPPNKGNSAPMILSVFTLTTT